VPFPGAVPNLVGKKGHLVQDGMDHGDDVFSVHDHGCPSRGMQSHVENGAVSRDIDPSPPEHGADPLAKAGFTGQLQEEPERLIGKQVL